MRTDYRRTRHTRTLILAALLCSGMMGCYNSQPAPEPMPADPRGFSVGGAAAVKVRPQDSWDPQKRVRHTVFFKFKEGSSKEDIQGVVDAFKKLPEKIETIAEFEWGLNNSPEGLDDGFTHCFCLSFKNAKDRNEYIPHPAHSGEFADVLRPHMEDVFVIDYWGRHYEQRDPEQLRHMVFFKFKDDATEDEIKTVISAFSNLRASIKTIRDFERGENNSPEKNDDGFTHAFVLTFASEEGRKEYLEHEKHLEFVELLKPHLDKARVLDYFVEP